MVDGKLDVAGVWGPFAGWLKAKGDPLTLQPTNKMDDIIPMEFEVAMGVRKTDAITKYAIDAALTAHRDEIGKILEDYGVPLVECADCLVSGTIPAHGIYTAPTVSPEEMAKLRKQNRAVSHEQLDKWLKDGADVDAEFADAVLASDNDRIGLPARQGRRHQQEGSAGLYAADLGRAPRRDRNHRLPARPWRQGRRARQRRLGADPARGAAQRCAGDPGAP